MFFAFGLKAFLVFFGLLCNKYFLKCPLIIAVSIYETKLDNDI